MASSENHPIVWSTLAIILTLGCCAGARAAEFAGGTGEPNDPYQIATAEQLIAIGSYLYNKHFMLTADIDLDPNLPGGFVFSRSLIASYGLQPRGKSLHVVYGRFEGLFDGNGHVIRNMVVHVDDKENAGLFGYVGTSGRIRNLGLEDVEIRPSSAGTAPFIAGSLVAINEGGEIVGCYATGAIVGPNQAVPPAGGVPAVRAVAASDHHIGGLVGENRGIVNACYALVSVTGTGVLGGLVGQNEGAVLFSFSAGAVTGTGWPGGLIGQSEAGAALRCYWDTLASGILDSAGGEGRTSAELMSRQTYASWVHAGTWTLDDANDYPRLVWEQAPGTLIGNGQPAYEGGSGDLNDPYQIATAEQFMTIGCHPEDFDKSFILTADVDFKNIDCSQVLPIGFEHVGFSGQFDGQAHSLSNLTVSRARDTGVGVFGVVGVVNPAVSHASIHYTIGDNGLCSWGGGEYRGGSRLSASNGEIRNLHLLNVTVVGREYVGGLIGLADSVVTDCSVTGRVTGLSIVGGLIGRSVGGTISACEADTQVSGEFGVGGLIGLTWGHGLSFLDCRAGGQVTGQLHTGGLIGSSQYDAISRCAARARVQGRYFTGGCIGYLDYSTVTAASAVCTVTTEQWAGGFVGRTEDGFIRDSYCQANVTGASGLGGFSGSYYQKLVIRDPSQDCVTHCYAASTVTAFDLAIPFLRLGGFSGSVSTMSSACVGECPMDISSCFWDTDLSGLTEATSSKPVDPARIAGLPTAQMQTAATFINAGWDFTDTWTICEGKDYPRLRWEGLVCGAGD
jgi:hypothetical protein